MSESEKSELRQSVQATVRNIHGQLAELLSLAEQGRAADLYALVDASCETLTLQIAAAIRRSVPVISEAGAIRAAKAVVADLSREWAFFETPPVPGGPRAHQ